MSLVELIAQADERSLAASGLACLDRCVPLLGADDDVLRPLWACLAEADAWAQWGTRLEQARAKLDAGTPEPPVTEEDHAAVLTRLMLDTAPERPSEAELRAWADACSLTALRAHRHLDHADDTTSWATVREEGRTEGLSPLVAAELRRQSAVLELLDEHGTSGLRFVLDTSIEARRVLRAVVSRRARGRA
ncbi:hypothetical protein AB0912_20615 [Streptomyces sp. NPDC007084]|uniref:hypothetical protein n=1 Tax=Streptomyces sp. NPDC007084 TaxID=3154313 RepID=UPI0034531CF0